ncbi:sulfurtransferase TusA family protein [Marinobacter sp. 1Y8]
MSPKLQCNARRLIPDDDTLKRLGKNYRYMNTIKIDTCGMRCPMPLLKTKLQLNSMVPGDHLEVVSDDPGSARDIPAYLKLTAHELEQTEESGGQFRFLIRCGDSH